MEELAVEGRIKNWHAFNTPEPLEPHVDLENYGEVIATFDILRRRKIPGSEGVDGRFEGQTITIRRFDPFLLADPDELDFARSDPCYYGPFKDMYRAYFSYWPFKGIYSCEVSLCRLYFTNFKCIRESDALKRHKSGQSMEFMTMNMVKDPRGIPYLRFIMPFPSAIPPSRGVGWAKQRRFGRATAAQHAVLSLDEVGLLASTESEFEHMTTQQVARTQVETLQESQSTQLERTQRELDRRRGMQGQEADTNSRGSRAP